MRGNGEGNFRGRGSEGRKKVRAGKVKRTERVRETVLKKKKRVEGKVKGKR